MVTFGLKNDVLVILSGFLGHFRDIPPNSDLKRQFILWKTPENPLQIPMNYNGFLGRFKDPPI